MLTALFILIAIVVVIAGLVAYALNYPRYDSRAAPGIGSVEYLVGCMTTDEKLEQLSGDLPSLRFQLRYAANVFSGRGAPHVYAGQNTRLGIPPLVFTDGPRGVAVGTGATCFPVTMCRGASWDPDLERRIGEAMGRETRAIDANYSAAVCVNLLRHPGWGRAQETYGEDPYHLGVMGTALTKGIQAHNVMACVKHFALNSIENSRFYVDVEVDERALREVYLPHFKRIVQEGEVASVMSAYNRVRGEFCGQNRELLTQILRQEWGFQGFVSSDWVHGVRDGIASVEAGLDVEMPCKQHYGAPLRDAVHSGTIALATIDESVSRVLRTRMRVATAEEAQPYGPHLLACAEHVELAQEAAEAGTVLLKNDGTLPLQPGNIGVFGHLATLETTGDHGSSAVQAPYVITPLEGIRCLVEKRGGTVRHDDGASPFEAAKLAKKCDAAVIVVGLSAEDEGEYFVLRPDEYGEARQLTWIGGGGDRFDLGLRPTDIALIRAVTEVNQRTVVVLVGGSAILVGDWGDWVQGVLAAFYGGMAGGTALARILFGEVNPSGKLPFTIPKDPKDLPPFDPFARQARYDRYHGYTLFEKRDLPVAYAFGHGLSYTTFAYSELTVCFDEILRVSVRIANTGDRAGAEVVQVYIGFPESAVDRPTKLLRGFEKIDLQAAESRTLTFEIPAEELAYYDTEAREWCVEHVTHSVSVGGSSQTSLHASCAIIPGVEE